jgi:hypothetical protein
MGRTSDRVMWWLALVGRVGRILLGGGILRAIEIFSSIGRLGKSLLKLGGVYRKGGDVVGSREWCRVDGSDFPWRLFCCISNSATSGDGAKLGDLIASGCLIFSLPGASAVAGLLGDLMRPPLEAGGLKR